MYDNFSRERWVHSPTCRTEVGALLRPCLSWWCSGQKRAENVKNVVAGALRRAWAYGLRVRIMFQAFLGSWVRLPRTAFSLHPLLSQKGGCTHFGPLPNNYCSARLTDLQSLLTTPRTNGSIPNDRFRTDVDGTAPTLTLRGLKLLVVWSA